MNDRSATTTFGNSAPSVFPRRHRLLRAVWSVTWLVLAAWTPPPLHRWRCLLLRLFGARIAPGARVYGSARVWYPPNLVMEPGAVLGWKAFCYSMAPVTIGAHATVSQFAHLVAGTHDTEDAGFALRTRPIVVEPHAWIATGAFVGPGVTVGEGAVLGACGVAMRDLAPWTVHAGNPARPVRARRNFVAGGGA